MVKTKEEYKEFEKSLLKHFKNTNIKDIDNLRFKMTNKGYRRKKLYDKTSNSFYIDDEYQVSDKQVKYAYDFLSKEGQIKQTILEVRFNYVRETGYKSRANENIIFNGKTYNKGQYLPREILEK